MARSDRSDKILQERLGYHFTNTALLDQALTHISALSAPQSESPQYQRLEFLGDRVLGLIIADNGIGIDPAQGESQGFGILGMRERVASLKGSLSLLSETGRGVRIQIELPLQLE